MPWKQGQSGNPNGRPRKSQKTMAQLLEGKGLEPDTDLCGFMLETYQGWGAIFYPDEYIKELVIFSLLYLIEKIPFG